MAITKISTSGMSREEWEAARMGSIGGSDASAVVGLNPYKSPYALWAEKTGVVTPEDISGKEAVRLGQYLEQYVADRFTEETGLKVRRETAILKNSEYPFAHANVDRLIVGQKAGLECKTTTVLGASKKFTPYPDNYYVQCMHYMAITGYPVWYLAVLIGNSEFRIFKIERNEEEITALMTAEREFWEGVERGTAPPVDGAASTTEALGKIYEADAEQTTVDLTPVCGSLREYLDLKAQMAELQNKMEAVANGIKEYMGGAISGSYESVSVSWKPTTTTRLDSKLVKAADPDLWKLCSKQTSTRRFEVKERT